jgi:TonB-linked SusC/RagA family outer membrane protein
MLNEDANPIYCEDNTFHEHLARRMLGHHSSEAAGAGTPYRDRISGSAPPALLACGVRRARYEQQLNERARHLRGVNRTAQTAGASSWVSTGGQSTVNMRGLQSQRTLVLLDGRRVVPSNHLGIVDVNLFPQALIRRTEVVTGGASAAYGSDAIAGVTNFIIDSEFTGFSAHMQGGISDREDVGNVRASAAGGFPIGERMHVVMCGEYYRAGGIPTSASREWYKSWGTLNFGASGGVPNQTPQRVRYENTCTRNNTFGGMITHGPLAGIHFLSDGTPAYWVDGILDGGATTGRNISTGANPNGVMQGNQVGGSCDFHTNQGDYHSVMMAGQERASYFGRISYDYNQKYLLTGTIRRDGASTFAPGHQWGTFPSVSAGWRITEEPFFNVPWINELKLRGSWGQLGNSSIEGGAYPHLLAVALQSTYTLNGTAWTEDVPIPLPRFPNPALTWESTTTTDVGFEASFFNHAFDFAATYYNRNTSDFLLNVDLPASSGFIRSPFNSGEVNNRGIELEAGYRMPRLVPDLDLHISGNFTTVRNRLLSLSDEIEAYTPPGDGGVQSFAAQYRTAPDRPVGFFYGFQTCGVYQTAAEAAQAPIDRTIGGRRPQAGDMCFVDRDGDGEITEADRTYLGKNIPGFYYGLNLNANFRRFDLTAFFNGVGDVQLYNQVRRDLEGMWGGGDNFAASTQNRWRPDNPSTTMPRAIAGDPVGNARYSDRWIENGSFFRLRTLQLGYTMPQGFLGTQNTRVYLSAQNLLTITPYSGYDPEFTTTIDHWRSRNDLALFQGTDTGDMPQPRVFQIGVSTAF